VFCAVLVYHFVFIDLYFNLIRSVISLLYTLLIWLDVLHRFALFIYYSTSKSVTKRLLGFTLNPLVY